MIEVENLTKAFGDRAVVNNVSFTVKKGDVLGLLGPNGAGKSTVMKMICGFLKPDQGSVRIKGVDMQANPISAKASIGYLPEGMPLYSEMPVNSFLSFHARVRGLRGYEIPLHIAKTVGNVNIGHVLTQPIYSLSKGYKRRVGLAQALLHEPDILILDEPTDGLDPLQQEQVHRLIQSLSADKAIILSTHALTKVQEICTRVIIIDQGDIVINQDIERIKQQSKIHHAIKLRLKTAQREEVIQALLSIGSVQDVRYVLREDSFLIMPAKRSSMVDDIWKAVKENEWQVHTLEEVQGSIDDVFKSITKN